MWFTNNTITISGLSPAQFDAFSFSGGDKDQVLPIVLANFEVSLEKGEWPQALSACMNKYEQAERYDDVIEAYTLLKKATELLWEY